MTRAGAIADESSGSAGEPLRPPVTDRPLRITLVEFSPAGGLFQFALQLGEGLADLGHDVTLVTGPDPEMQPRNKALRVVPLLPTWRATVDAHRSILRRKLRRLAHALPYLRAWFRLGTFLRHQRPDVVQFAALRFALDGAVLVALRRMLPATLLLDVMHGTRPLDYSRTERPARRSGPLLDRLLAAGYRACDAVLVLGETSRLEVLEHWSGLRHVSVIPHGDESLFATHEVPPAEAAPPTALFFGVLTRYKGLEVLLRAFADVRGQVPDARLVIAGALSGDVDREELTRAAASVPGVDLRIGYVPAGQVADLVGAARLVVAPYLFANQSGVVHLAHTLARPVVASRVGDLPDVVLDGRTGLLVPPGEPEPLAAALTVLLEDPSYAGRLGREGQSRVRSEASWTTVAQRVDDVYQRLLDGNGERP